MPFPIEGVPLVLWFLAEFFTPAADEVQLTRRLGRSAHQRPAGLTAHLRKLDFFFANEAEMDKRWQLINLFNWRPNKPTRMCPKSCRIPIIVPISLFKLQSRSQPPSRITLAAAKPEPAALVASWSVTLWSLASPVFLVAWCLAPNWQLDSDHRTTCCCYGIQNNPTDVLELVWDAHPTLDLPSLSPGDPISRQWDRPITYTGNHQQPMPQPKNLRGNLGNEPRKSLQKHQTGEDLPKSKPHGDLTQWHAGHDHRPFPPHASQKKERHKYQS